MHVAICALVGALGWRLRGGAFTTLTGIDLGTDFARVIGAAAIAAPLAILHGPLYAILIPLIFAGLIATGWGPFQGLGLPSPYAPERSWLRWLPLRLGLKTGTVAHDAVGLAEAGVICVAPSAVFFGITHGVLAGVLALTVGLGFPIAYAIPRIVRLPAIPKFSSGQAWGEVFVGALIGAAFSAISSGVVHG